MDHQKLLFQTCWFVGLWQCNSQSIWPPPPPFFPCTLFCCVLLCILFPLWHYTLFPWCSTWWWFIACKSLSLCGKESPFNNLWVGQKHFYCLIFPWKGGKAGQTQCSCLGSKPDMALVLHVRVYIRFMVSNTCVYLLFKSTRIPSCISYYEVVP